MNSLPTHIKPAPIIRRIIDLRRLVDDLRGEPLLAVDSESNSLFAYYERVCLVQLSTRTHDYIIDPLSIDDMSPLGELLADPAVEIVFHAAEYDIMTMKRDFNFTFAHVFDTMIAARVCGWEMLGLGNILADQFGITVEKKYQRANWTTRPLPEEQRLYAQMDTHYLPVLRDRLLDELTQLNRVTEAYETFAELADLPPAQFNFDPEGYWKIGQAHRLRYGQMGQLRELYLLRDSIARQRNLPPFKVLSDHTLAELVNVSPRRVEDFTGVRNLSSDQQHYYGEQILQALARGRKAKLPDPPKRTHTPDPDIQMRYEALHEWRKQRATERGVESDVIVPRNTLWALARRVPTRVEDLDDIPGLGPWRRAEYGEELLHVLARIGDNHLNK